MKKVVFTFIFVLTGLLTFSQVTIGADAKELKAVDQLKSALISKAGLSAATADKIVIIEAEFFNNLAVINGQKNLSTKEKEKKLNKAHVTRRSKLAEVPFTGCQMEDIISLSESVKRSNK